MFGLIIKFIQGIRFNKQQAKLAKVRWNRKRLFRQS
jgi:hypothetical protein